MVIKIFGSEKGLYHSGRSGTNTISFNKDIKPISLKNLVCKIESITGNRAQICYSKTDQADTIITHACIKKAYGKIDWEPKNEIDYGLKKCVEWYEDERSWLRQLIT